MRLRSCAFEQISILVPTWIQIGECALPPRAFVLAQDGPVAPSYYRPSLDIHVRTIVIRMTNDPVLTMLSTAMPLGFRGDGPCHRPSWFSQQYL
jgi:hypothetical protein